jgi:phosphate transport system protein
VSDLRTAYHQEIEDVRSKLVRLAGSVIEAIPRATSILLESDLEGANYLIASDDEIDARSLDLEEEIYRLMALQAPVAVDLRVLVSAVKILGEIERSADLAVNICKAARRLYGHALDPRLRGLITKMAEQAQALFTAAIDAYVDNDAAKAAAIDDMDSLLDALQGEFIQVIFESHAAARIDLQVAVQLAVVARFYERIGDHAVNIGERVNYTVTGWLPEHDGAARYRERREDSPAPETAEVEG